LPEVEIPIQVSPSLAIASTCLAKTFLNPKLLPIEVREEVPVVSAVAYNPSLSSILYSPTNSVAIC